jgi:hypothetical protein
MPLPGVLVGVLAHHAGEEGLAPLLLLLGGGGLSLLLALFRARVGAARARLTARRRPRASPAPPGRPSSRTRRG